MRGSIGCHVGTRRRALRPLGAALALVLALPLLGANCRDRERGDPVDQHHYEHTMTLSRDYSSVAIHTFVNRTHLLVGLRREVLYDGDRDGALATPGMDRVSITDYMDVEDPPEKAIHTKGEIRDYDELFQSIVEAARSGKDDFEIEDRTYDFRYLPEVDTPLASKS